MLVTSVSRGRKGMCRKPWDLRSCQTLGIGNFKYLCAQGPKSSNEKTKRKQQFLRAEKLPPLQVWSTWAKEWNPVAATTELIIARLSRASPQQSPRHHTFLCCFWLLKGNFFRLIPTSCSAAVRALPAVRMHQRFSRFCPINTSQMHLSLPVLLLNSYLGSHHLMSQLLQHPFPGHWQTHSCPDGVLIHNAAAEIIPQPGFLFTHLPGSSSFSYQTINWPSLSRTLPPYCSFIKVNSHTWTVHSSCFYSSLANFVVSLETLCHICEKCETLLCCSPSTCP